MSINYPVKSSKRLCRSEISVTLIPSVSIFLSASGSEAIGTQYTASGDELLSVNKARKPLYSFRVYTQLVSVSDNLLSGLFTVEKF